VRTGLVQFIVANCGAKLDWIPQQERFEFWKMIRPQIADPMPTVSILPGIINCFGIAWIGRRHRNMNIRLPSLGWARVGTSILLIGLSALCGLRTVIAGIVYGDIMDLPGRSTQAAEYQHRAYFYFWTCLLLQGLATLVLGPTLQSLGGRLHKSGPLKDPTNYALALGISILGTGLTTLLFFLLIRSGFISLFACLLACATPQIEAFN